MTDSVDLLKQIVSLKPGGEVREQQQTAVAEIESALHEDKNLLLEAPTGSGKALCVKTPILTTKGWTTMGKLVEGDVIYGTNGTTTVTTAHSPFMSKRLYLLKFSNGAAIKADSEHLWNIAPHSGAVSPALHDAARVEELRPKTIKVSTSGSALQHHAPSFPRDLILRAASYSKAVEETDTLAVFDLNELVENIYREILDRGATWTTQEIADAYADGDISPFKITLNNPITLPEPDKKFPVPSRMYGEWLAGNESVFTEQQIQSLTDLGIISSNQIPEDLIATSVAVRNQVLLGIYGGHEFGTFQTTSTTLAEDIVFLTATLGRACAREQYFENNKLVELITLLPVEENTVSLLSISEVEPAMVRCITVDSEDHLFLAGRELVPTHNTLSYLIPLVQNDTRAVVSTATKQLSEQIMGDIDFLNSSLKSLKSSKRANATLLKGRDNYLCLAKYEDIMRLEDRGNTLFGVEEAKNEVTARANKMASESKAVSDWANETETGDRSEGPASSDEMWRQYSSTNAECPGKSACPFGQECFAEIARDKAKESQLVITNHAIVALDLEHEGQLLGDREVFVFDELHELDTYMSSAWGAELTYTRLDSTYKTIKAIPSIDEKYSVDLKALIDEFDKTLRSVEKGLIDNQDSSIKLENYLIRLVNLMGKLVQEISKKEKDSGTEALKRIYTKGKKVAMELHGIAETLARTDVENVRWTKDSADRKFEPKKPTAKRGKATSAMADSSKSSMSIHAAPLRIGPKLQDKLSEREATMIGLSATVTVMGRTDIPLHNFGLDKKPHKVVVLDTPFDYKKQAMLYIPNPSSFPLPMAKTKKEHAEAMMKDSSALIKASGGRALILSTTSENVDVYAAHYRKAFPKMNILAQGDAPNSQLVSEFKEEEESCLIGTMGFWHGLDAPGKTLTLDIIDKIPFPSPEDPLLAARKEHADKMGGNGFMEIYVTIADWMLRQGFGRAIRSKSDRAVIAIYDPRLVTKNYGRAIMQNFHGVGLYHEHAKVVAALERLVGSYKN